MAFQKGNVPWNKNRKNPILVMPTQFVASPVQFMGGLNALTGATIPAQAPAAPTPPVGETFAIGDRVMLKDYDNDGNYLEVKNSGELEGQIVRITGDSEPNWTHEILFDYRNWKLLAKASNIMYVRPKEKVHFESVVLADEKKEEIRSAISQLENSKLIFEDWGFGEVFEKGTAITLMFYGIPGTGKTLMAQAIADEVGGELKVYGTAEIESSEPGGAERAIKKIFTTAQNFFKTKGRQQVILLDECDSLLYDRNKVGVILGAQINTMLTEIEKHNGIIILTTNRMGKLDPALERRISAKIEFPFPDAKQREAIWLRMIPSKAPIAPDVSYAKLAKYPMAGGNIKNAVLNAARMAAYKKATHITMAHFTDAVEKESESLLAFKKQKDDARSAGDYMTDNEGGSLNKTIGTGKEKVMSIKRTMKMK